MSKINISHTYATTRLANSGWELPENISNPPRAMLFFLFIAKAALCAGLLMPGRGILLSIWNEGAKKFLFFDCVSYDL